MFNFSKKVRKNNVVKLLFLFFLLLLASGFMPHVSAEEFSDNETMVVDTLVKIMV